MAGLVNWKKAAIPAANPDPDHVYVGIDSADSQIYAKDSTGATTKFATQAFVGAAIADFETTTELNARDAANRGRANHTGTQNANTISNFTATVRVTALTGLSLLVNTAITATDTVIVAFGKLQAQITDAVTTLTSHIGNTSNPHSTTAAQVGLGNVDNTSDANKPISTATQTALNAKYDSSNPAGYQTASDVNTLLGGKANLAGGNTFTGNQRIDSGTFGLGVGGANAASALAQINSTTQGFLPPRMTSAQRLAITTPAQGLVVYDTSLNAFCVYTGTTWIYETTVRNTSVTSTTNNFFGNVPDLVSASLEVGFYQFNARIVVQSTSTANGIGIRVNSASSSANVLGQWKFPESSAVTGLSFVGWIQEANTDDGTSSNAPFINQDFIVCGEGLIEITSPGTVAIALRSENFGTGVSVRQRSVLTLKKVN